MPARRPSRNAGSSREWRPQIKNADVLAAGRQRLADAARHCFVEAGYSQTTVNDVADAAGMSVGSVYKHIYTKADLLAIIAEAAHKLLAEPLSRALEEQPSATDALNTALRANLRFCHDGSDVVRLFFEEFRYMPRETQRRIREQDAGVVAVLADVIRRGNVSGEFACGDVQFVASHISGMGTTWVMKRRHLLPGMTFDEYAAAMERSALRMVGAPPRRSEGAGRAGYGE